MKRLALMLMITTIPAFAQAISPPPDCTINFQFSATSGTTVSFDNRFAGCQNWDISYSTYNVTGLSLTAQSAPDSGGTPGTYVNFIGPLTAQPYGASSASGSFVPWLKVIETGTFSMAGVVNGALIGWKPGRSITGSGIIACVGTPGNTSAGYLTECATTAGALYLCNNPAGCTVSADWVAVTGSGSFTYPSGTGIVQVAGGAAWGTTLANPLTAAAGGSGVSNTATHTLGTANQNWATLGTGIVKNTTTTGALSDAASSDVISLWSGTCNSSTVLFGGGACAAPFALTTTGTSGAATFTSGTLNIPNYAVGGAGVTSIAGTTNQVTASASTGAVTLSLPTVVHIGTTGTGLVQVSANAASLPAALTGTLLQVGNADTVSSRVEADGFAGTGYFTGVRWDGTAASPTALVSGNEIGGFNAWGYNGTSVVGPFASFRTYAKQNWSVGANGTYADIATTNNATATMVEVMRFENNGGVTVPSTVTGGDEGAGTLNAGGLYVNGVSVTSFTAPFTSPATRTITAAIADQATLLDYTGIDATAATDSTAGTNTALADCGVLYGTLIVPYGKYLTVDQTYWGSSPCTVIVDSGVQGMNLPLPDGSHFITYQASQPIIPFDTYSIGPLANASVLGTTAASAWKYSTANDLSSVISAAGGGSANAQTATLSPAITAYGQGATYCWSPVAPNSSTTPTVAFNGLAATTITKNGATALVANDIIVAQPACVKYFGSTMILQDPATSIACGTCVVASSPGVGLAHFAGSTQTVTSSAVALASADVSGQLSVANGGTGDATLTAYAPLVGGTTTTAAVQSSVVGTSGQMFVSQGSATKPTYIDFPERYMIPAANCNNTTAGAGWSIGSGGTVTCRAGTNNLGGFISITDTSSTFAQFQLSIPTDWDTATNPYILFGLISVTDTTNGHTIIPQIRISCPTATNGTVSDDHTLAAAHSATTITMGASAVANGFYTTNVQMNSTDMTGCVAGGMFIVQVGRATDTATGVIGFEYANVTFPRLLVVQAN